MDPPRDRPAGQRGSDFASPDRLARVLAIALELSCRIGILPRRCLAEPGGIRARPVPVRQARFLRVDTTPELAFAIQKQNCHKRSFSPEPGVPILITPTKLSEISRGKVTRSA